MLSEDQIKDIVARAIKGAMDTTMLQVGGYDVMNLTEFLGKLGTGEIQVQRNDGWISVKDGLPDTNGKYLVLTTGIFGAYEPYVDTAMFLTNLRSNREFDDDYVPDGPGFYNGDGVQDWIEENITHWMPLPESPKEDEE